MVQHAIQIRVPDGTSSAYLSRPSDTSLAPAIVVIQEIFGVKADMRETCDSFTTAGFLALCPDLFWRLQPEVELTDQHAFARHRGLHHNAACASSANTRTLRFFRDYLA